MGLKTVSWVRGHQGQCRALRPLGAQDYRLRNYKKDPPLCSGYTVLLHARGLGHRKKSNSVFLSDECHTEFTKSDGNNQW